jgi:hypothetical protein
MQSKVRWATAILGIAIVGVMLFGNVPSTHFVGGAGAVLPTHEGSSSMAGAPKAIVRSAANPHVSEGPHPGTLEIWEATSGGPETVDPSVCYYTVCDEPISNVYQTLIAYNGTDDGPTPDNYVPQLATCVPGSLECAAQFGGNDLVYPNATTGAPQYYTFEIDSGARFYDSAHAASWGVYPSDVVFTFARTMGFADLQYEEQTNGWINTQDLVPLGNPGWDSGIHAPLNNTPSNILNAFIVNDSTYCPQSVVVATNGCVTFNVGASGQAWPYFLELLADNLGGSIQPCGWYTAQSAGVPGFTGTSAANGDGPCLLPGGTTSTTQPGYENYVNTTGPTGWDSFELEADNWPANQPGVQWSDVGSGPYYVDNPISPASGYTMVANPAYAAPVGCAGQPGCQPVAGTYVPNVDIVWESGTVGDQTGLTEMEAGQADSAGFFSSDLQQVQTYVKNYTLLTNIPTLTIGFFPLDLTFNVTNEQTQDLTGQLNVPGNFLQNDALRQFLVNSFPYKTIDDTFNEVNNTLFGEAYGGAIPHNMGDYYPTNISWPTGDPVSSPGTVGNVTWWWAQANDPSSSLYDPELAACTSSAPCRWATFSFLGDTPLDDQMNLWNSEVATLSGGNLTPYLVDQSGNVLITDLGSPPGQNPLPVYDFGWAPDYPDPSDYMAPMYYPSNSYTSPDSVAQTMALSVNNASTCPNDYGAWSNLTYWAGLTAIPADCQGAAYDTMVSFMNQAQFNANVPQRGVEYNLVEQIANKLALYVYDPQSVAVIDYGNWIQPTTINTNPVFGGGGVQLWYDWNYAALYHQATFTEAGLLGGTNWTVTVDGTQYSSLSTTTVTVPALTDGVYAYTIGGIAGYTSNPVSGTFTISAANASVFVTYTAITGPTYVLTFAETGLAAGTTWTVTATSSTGGAVATGNTTSIATVALPAASYTYAVRPVTGYNTPAGGTVDLTGAMTVNVTFLSKTYSGYAVTFTETGLPSGSSWAISVNGTVHTESTATIVVTLGNGSYSWGVTSFPTGYTDTPSAGTFSVVGAVQVVDIKAAAVQSVTPASNPAWTYLSTLAWVLIGVLALLVIIFLALALMAGRRPPSSPPESWSSSSSTPTDMKGNSGGSS